MAKIELQNGMVVRVPIQLVNIQDRSNVLCLAGTRTVLMDGAFLEDSTEVVSGPPPAQKDQLTAIAEALTVLQARLDKLEAPQPAPLPPEPPPAPSI